MTPDLSKDIQHHVWLYSFSHACKLPDRPVSHAIADGHLIFLGHLCGYVCVNILTFITLGGAIQIRVRKTHYRKLNVQASQLYIETKQRMPSDTLQVKLGGI